IARIVSTGHALPRWASTVAVGVSGAAIGVLLGGDLPMLAIAFLAAMGIDVLKWRMSRRRLPDFYQQVAGGLLDTLAATCTTAACPSVLLQPFVVITASVIMLLAGVGFMGAIQDALTVFYITGGARILDALLATAEIIAGVSGGLTVARMLGLDMGFVQ